MLKTIVDVSMGILLAMKYMESKEDMADAKYNVEWGATMNTTLRLAEYFAGKGRIFIADSWFGSVGCAFALKKMLGMFSIMVVKTKTQRGTRRHTARNLPKNWEMRVALPLR